MTTRRRSTALAGYVKYAPDDKRALALRAEYFDDNQGWTAGTAQELSEFTATLPSSGVTCQTRRFFRGGLPASSRSRTQPHSA
jgi:hypothetical protein